MTSFQELKLCDDVKKRLIKAGYTTATEIQIRVLEHIKNGKDVIGSAKTGSGKTLAFVVPMLDMLIEQKITRWDGVQVIILSPTRELAYQTYTAINNIFGVPLNKKYLDFSIGLSIGGKDSKTEKEHISRNILVCTPGRLKDHIERNPYFNCDSFQLLIIDEADQMVDPGFIRDVSHIIENLPKSHQTLVFSATLNDSVKLLCKKLGLKKPVRVCVDQVADANTTKTPDLLMQKYYVCPLQEKINFVFSFIKAHRGQKVLIFMASCKQVKYTYELFCKLRPGSPLMALYGTLHQLRRMSIYDEFCRKSNVVMFATDIAARGLDFPSVDVVLQLDAPADVKTYIHRAGRTARANKGGQSVLVLLPSEEKALLNKLHENQIVIKPYVFHWRIYSIQRRAETFCAMDVNLKESAQRAFKSYLKSIYLMKDKQIFNFTTIEKEPYAKSLGLLITPRVRVLERTKPGGNLTSKSTDVNNKDKTQTNEEKSSIVTQPTIKYPMKKKQTISLLDGNVSDDEDDELNDLLTVKNKWKFDGTDTSDLPVPAPDEPIELDSICRVKKSQKPISKAAVVKKLMKKQIKPNTKITFDDEGNPIQDITQLKQTSSKLKELEEASMTRSGGGIDIELAKQVLKDEDTVDKELHRKLVKEKHKEQRRIIKEKKRKPQDAPPEMRLLASGDSEDDNEDAGSTGYDDVTSQYIDQLPDPDAAYGNNEDSNDSEGGDDQFEKQRDNYDDDEQEEEDEEEEEIPVRRKKPKMDIDNEALALHMLRTFN